MAVLPPANAFAYDPDDTQNSDVGPLFNEWLEATKQLPGGKREQLLSLDANGSFTPTGCFNRIDSFGGSGADDLVAIETSGMPSTNGNPHGVVFLRIADSTRPITVKHNAGSTKEIFLVDSQDLVLTSTSMRLGVFYSGSQWLEFYRNYGTARSAGRSFLGLGGASTMGEATTEQADDGGDGEDDSVITPRRLKRYRPQVSTQKTIGASLTGTFSHGLGAVPSDFGGMLECINAERGYSIGDRINVSPANIQVWANNTTVGFSCNDDPIDIIVKAGGVSNTLTYANWRMILWAVK